MRAAATSFVGSRSNRWLRIGLVGLLGALNVKAVFALLAVHPIGVDLEIPLRAAERWSRGEPPYLLDAFGFSAGPNLPFLYPPPVLLLVAPLVTLPRLAILGTWVVVCAGAAALACRRLGIGLVWWPFALTWPPFAEAILGGNIQVFLILAFATLCFVAPAGEWSQGITDVRLPAPVDPRERHRPAAIEGLLAAVPAAVKISQVHAFVWIARRRPIAAALGLGLLAGVALVSVPMVGVETWVAWIGQAERASDPAWRANGAPLSAYVGRIPALAISVVSVAAAAFVPTRRAGAWLGILAILGAPALHIFNVLFLLPAMLVIRRELGLLAAILIATYLAPMIWLAVGVVGWSFLASTRWPVLLEPEDSRTTYDDRRAAADR
jgi:hypothetical protein